MTFWFDLFTRHKTDLSGSRCVFPQWPKTVEEHSNQDYQHQKTLERNNNTHYWCTKSLTVLCYLFQLSCMSFTQSSMYWKTMFIVKLYWINVGKNKHHKILVPTQLCWKLTYSSILSMLWYISTCNMEAGGGRLRQWKYCNRTGYKLTICTMVFSRYNPYSYHFYCQIALDLWEIITRRRFWKWPQQHSGTYVELSILKAFNLQTQNYKF